MLSCWDANDYCGWVGKRIPTEAEWEEGGARARFICGPWPWGSEILGLHQYEPSRAVGIWSLHV